MHLHDFPRPRADNGRGVHWSASVMHPTGAALDFWMAELHAMNITWVKLLDDGGGSSVEVCQRLRQGGIMPIVRLYRPASTPLSLREEETVARLVTTGARYIETDETPDAPDGWPNGARPDDWLDRVADSFIPNAERVLALGGLPALPAMAPAHSRAALAAVVQRGRRDLFERGAWLALHADMANRPLNYPYDPVNQHGAPLTQGEYDALLAAEAQPANPSFAWDDQAPSLINRWRADEQRPGATIYDDDRGFLRYLLYGEMAMQELGFAVPVIATAGGPTVGNRADRRYPRLTPHLHADTVTRLFRFMQEKAPPWFFAVCPSLLANAAMDNTDPAWEPLAWYGDHHNRRFDLRGVLPIVDRLKALATRPRVPTTGTGRITGTLQTATGTVVSDFPLTLWRDGRATQTTPTDFTGGFRFENLPAGVYAIHAHGQTLQDGIALADGETRTANLQLGEGQHARLMGRVVDTQGRLRAGIVVELYQDGARLAEHLTDAAGVYAFAGLARGVYALATDTTRVDDLALDGWNAVEVDLVVAASADVAPQPHASRIEGCVDGGREGQRLVLYSGQQRWTSTLSPALRFAFGHLPAGTYTLTLDGVGIVAEGITLDGANTVTLTLTAPAMPTAPASVYVLLSLTEPISLRAALLLLLPHLRRDGLVAGFSLAEAMQMERVILVSDAADANVERVLQGAGRPVERWPGDTYQLVAFLQRRQRATP